MKISLGVMVSIVIFAAGRLPVRALEESASVPLPEAANELTASAPDTATRHYVVEEGEDLYTVALMCLVSPAKLKEMNGLSGTDLTAGQRIKIPHDSLFPGVATDPRDKGVEPGKAETREDLAKTSSDEGGGMKDNVEEMNANMAIPAGPAEEVADSASEMSNLSSDPMQAAQPVSAARMPESAAQDREKDRANTVSPAVKIGDAKEVVLSAWGEPRGFMKKTSSEVLTYDQGLVFLDKGMIVGVKLRH